MKTKSIRYVVLACVLAFLLLMVTFQIVLAVAEPDQVEQSLAVPPLSQLESGWAIPLQQAATTATLQAASRANISFHPNNDPDPAVEVFIPHLVLYRDGNLTREVSRTPIVTANLVLSFSSLNSVIQKQEVVR